VTTVEVRLDRVGEEFGDEVSSDPRRQERFTGGDHRDGMAEVVGFDVFEEEAAGTGA